MLVGKPPFAQSPYFGGDTLTKIIRYSDGDLLVELPEDLAEETHDLILQLLSPEPAKRLGSAHARAHPFFQSFDFRAPEEQQLPPPFVPEVSSPTDTSNFDPFSDSDSDGDDVDDDRACLIQ